MKKLSNAFAYIFSDNEWFNKVLVGGLCLLLIPIGVGIIMLNGYLAEFLIKRSNGDKELPYWRNYQTIFSIGLRKSWFSLLLIAGFYLILFFAWIHWTIPVAILALTVFLTINTLSITKSADIYTLIISVGLLMVAISIGWMWIVVGWPLLIFLAILVQAYLFSHT